MDDLINPKSALVAAQATLDALRELVKGNCRRDGGDGVYCSVHGASSEACNSRRQEIKTLEAQIKELKKLQ